MFNMNILVVGLVLCLIIVVGTSISKKVELSLGKDRGLSYYIRTDKTLIKTFNFAMHT